MGFSTKQMMDIVLASVLEEVNKVHPDDTLCAAAKYPGEGVPLDYAECGGMLWVRMVQATPSRAFPQPVTDLNDCGAILAVPLEVGLMRPAPIPADFVTGEMDLPSDDDHNAAADKQADDMEAMWRGLKRAAQDIELLLIGSYSPVGPAAGSVGGTWTLTVGDD